MKRPVWPLLLCMLSMLPVPSPARAESSVVVIGHPGLPGVDRVTLMRLYTGRSIELKGTPVKVVNAAEGSVTRERFLQNVVGMNEARYRAYWTVRRHVGKGVPPAEVSPDTAVIEFVASTPGAIGYISAQAQTDTLNVIARH